MPAAPRAAACLARGFQPQQQVHGQGVAAKATTMPVMTMACGTGSPLKPAPAPRRAMTPNSRKMPPPSRLKARMRRSGSACSTTP
jgi:hypothetical protein